MAYARPGVYVEETLSQSNPDTFPSVSAAAFVGVAAKGPITPTRIESWSMFQRIFGGFSGPNQALAHAVFAFYNNGGRNAYIVRATGSGAALATRTLNDRQGTPAPVLRVDSSSVGAWGNTTAIRVSDGASAGRFNIDVLVGGNTVERWTDLSMDPNDGRYVVNVITNASGSSYISVADLFDHTGDLTSANIPAVTTTVGGDVLAGGVEGSAPTGGATGQLYTAVTQLDAVDDFLTVNVPGATDSTLVNAIITWAETRGTAFVVLDCEAGRTPAQAVTTANSYNASSYAAVYYPQLVVSDPSNTTPGTTRIIPPGGAVLGQIAQTDATRGTFKAPAGTSNRLSGVVALERKALDSELDALNNGRVNAIRNVPGSGICVFGARTLKPTQIDMYISVRRTLIDVRMSLTAATRFAAFEPNTDTLWETITAVCERVLNELWQAGGLRGSVSTQAYYVKCDSENNPQSSVNNGEVHVEVGLALVTPAEFVVLKIGQFESGSAVSEEV